MSAIKRGEKKVREMITGDGEMMEDKGERQKELDGPDRGAKGKKKLTA